MNATHTPAPWEIHTWKSQNCFPTVQIRFGKKYICGLPVQTGDKEPPEFDKSMRRNYYDDPDDAAQNLANAHLIAAAPRLLESLKDLENILSCKPYDRDEQKLLEIARATIAKAEGKAE